MAREPGCPMEHGCWQAGHTACPVKSSWESWEAHKTSNIVFLDVAAQSYTISVWLEVTDGVKMPKYSFQNVVRG